MENYTFDLQRILIGNLPVLFIVEIALRTTIMFLYLMFALRFFLGRRSMAQLSMFEFILLIGLGSAAGDPMFYPEIPVLHGIVVITVVVLIERGMNWLTSRNAKAEDILEGMPHQLVIDGRFDLDGMRQATLSHNEVLMKLRLAGVENLGQVKRSYLELNGAISTFWFDEEHVRVGLPLFPNLEINDLDYSIGTPVPVADDYACTRCGNVVTLQQGEKFQVCSRCQHRGWVNTESVSAGEADGSNANSPSHDK
jgi:uncharacterized membrane protein YcaP (DUF421 family)